MSLKKERFIKGVILAPDSIALDGLEGEIKVDSATGKIQTTLKDGANPSAAREILTSSQTQTLTNKTLDVDNNTVSNIETDNLKAGVLNTNTSLTGASDTQVPSALAAKTYIDSANTAQQNIIDDLVTLSGVASGAENLGTFTGTTIPDNSTNKQALQALETEVETKATSAALSTHTGASSDVHGVGVGNSVVGTGTSQALTNKTIDADLNTISNIEDADIKVGAAISRAKLASGTANRVVVNNSTGVQTDAAAITAARALISDANGIPTHSSVTSTELGYSSGVTSGIQTQLDAKVDEVGGTFTSGSVITPIRSDVKQDTKANLTTYALTASNGQIVFATDTKEYLSVKDGVLSAIGSGGGVGNINALLTQTFDLAALTDFTQTGLELVTTNMINGTQSARLIHQAGSSRSFKQVVAVDRKYRSEPMQLSLQVRSSASNGNLTLLVTDETNSATIAASQSISTGYQTIASLVTNATTTVSGFSNSVINGLSVGMTVTGSGIATGTLISAINTAALTITLSQAATASATVSLNFSALPDRRTFSFIIPANCASMSYTITALQEANAPESYIDDVVIELASTALLSTSVDVPNMTAWNGYTPTFQGFGTPTNVEFEWRQVGENVEIRGKFTSGTSTAVEARVGLPGGLTSAGTGLIPSIQVVGKGSKSVTATTFFGGTSVLIEPSVTYMTLGFEGSTFDGITKVSSTSSFVGVGNILSFFASVPCVGLSATSTKTIALTQSGLVQHADSSVSWQSISGIAYGVTNTRILNLTGGTFVSEGSDITVSSSSTLGTTFTVNSSGIYNFNFAFEVGSSASTLGWSRNSTQLTTSIASINAADRLVMGWDGGLNSIAVAAWSGKLNVGDVIRLHGDGTTIGINAPYHNLSITKQGSLKQVSVNPNSKITIPTSELRFEGASTRGSTATAIVKFDTLAKIRGDAFTVTNTAADGTFVTMLKAGKLNVSTSIFSNAANQAHITRNQSNLTALSGIASEILSSEYSPGAGDVVSPAWSGFVNIGDIIRVNTSAAISALSSNNLNLSFQEQDIAVSVTNTLPQFSESDSSVRVDTANGYGSTGTKIRRFSNVRDNIGTDVVYTDDAVNGASFTARTSGIYSISFSDNFTGASDMGISKNSSTLSTNFTSLTASERLAYGTTNGASFNAVAAGEFYLVAGDVIRAHTNGTASGTAAQTSFTISKVGKPNVTGVNVTPFVNVPQPVSQTAYYYGASALASGVAFTGALNSNTSNGIFSYNSTTGVFTVLKAATFNASFSIRNSAATRVDALIEIDGVQASRGTTDTAVINAWASASLARDLQAGQTISFRNQGTGSGDFVFVNMQATALSDQILTAPETFSTDTAALQYASSAAYTLATLTNAPVGTYITFTYAINTNTRTQTTTRPTQTDADMNANGMLIYTRAYNAASTAAQPAAFAVQIGKGLKGKSLDLYKSAGKVNAGNLDFAATGVSDYGAWFKDYNEVTGILLIDAGFCSNNLNTSHQFFFTDTTNQTSGYLVINASKNPVITGFGLNRISARAINTAGTAYTSTRATLTFDASKIFDTNGALNAATGIFTAPETGYYFLSSGVAFASAAYTAGQFIEMSVFKNGVLYSIIGNFVVPAAITTSFGTAGSDQVFLGKNDTLSISVRNSRGSTALDTTAGINYFTVSKVSV